MEIIFNKEEINKILIDKVKSMGFEVNYIRI